MNGQAIRFQEWEGCPNHKRMVDLLFSLWSHPAATEGDRKQIQSAARLLHDARVVKVEERYLFGVSQAIVDGLPGTTKGQTSDVNFELVRDRGGWALDTPLPFDPLWLELSGNAPHEGTCDGLLVAEQDGKLILFPFQHTPPPHPDLVPAVCVIDPRDMRSGTYHLVRGVDDVLIGPFGGDHGAETVDQIFKEVAGNLNALLYLLCCANVSVDAEPVSRQVRRAAERSNRAIPLTIQVRRSSTSIPRGGKANYSHSFERRGTFQHHPRGPIFENCKDPRKRVTRDGVECVRVWSPPTVVGSGPFIPKVRRVA